MNPLTQFKKILILPLLIALALVGCAQIARADAVLDWNDHAANAIVAVAAMPPPRGLIHLAMVHVAILTLSTQSKVPVNPFAVRPNVVTPASPEAATAAAAHDMLVALFPSQQADLDADVRGIASADPRRPS